MKDKTNWLSDHIFLSLVLILCTVFPLQMRNNASVAQSQGKCLGQESGTQKIVKPYPRSTPAMHGLRDESASC